MRTTAAERSQDATLLVAALAVLVLSAMLRLEPIAPHTATLFGVATPDLCPFHRLTGFWCPGCGLTRSFVSMAHGDFRLAYELNPMGPLLFAVALVQLPYRGLRLWGRVRTKPELFNRLATPSIGFIAGWLLLFGLYRIGWSFAHLGLARAGTEPPSTWPMALSVTALTIAALGLVRQADRFQSKRNARKMSGASSVAQAGGS